MGGLEGLEGSPAATFEAILPRLGERQRLVAAAAARALGHGGIRVVARATGRREARCAGAAELETGKGALGPQGRAAERVS